VEDIGIGSGRPPLVGRSEGSPSVYLTFRGTRETKVRDRDTRVRIGMPAAQAARLRRELGEMLSDQEKAGD
jgi:hypothetical protein